MRMEPLDWWGCHGGLFWPGVARPVGGSEPVMSIKSIAPAGRAARAQRGKKHLDCAGAAAPSGARKPARDNVASSRGRATPPVDNNTEGGRQAGAGMRLARC